MWNGMLRLSSNGFPILVELYEIFKYILVAFSTFQTRLRYHNRRMSSFIPVNLLSNCYHKRGDAQDGCIRWQNRSPVLLLRIFHEEQCFTVKSSEPFQSKDITFMAF